MCIFESANIRCNEVSHKDGTFYSEKQLNYLRCPSRIFLPSFWCSHAVLPAYKSVILLYRYWLLRSDNPTKWKGPLFSKLNWLWLFKIICEGEYLSCFVATLCLILQLPLLGLGPGWCRTNSPTCGLPLQDFYFKKVGWCVYDIVSGQF